MNFLNKLKAFLIWLGETIGKVMNPLILGIIFFLIITPTALICRLIGRDLLNLKQKKFDSYWKIREHSSLKKDSFKRQF